MRCRRRRAHIHRSGECDCARRERADPFSSDSPGLLTWDLASVGSEHSDGSDLAAEATEQANILGANAISPDGKTWAFSVGDFHSHHRHCSRGAVGQGDTTQAYANCLPSPDRPAGMYFLADNRLALFDSADGQYYTCSPDGAPSLVANPQPTLSPDGTHAWTLENSNLHVSRADSSGDRDLGVSVSAPSTPRRPQPVDWSPDGSRLVYASNGIWTISNDGSDAHQLTSHAGDTDPAWSPDGTMIAFARSGPFDKSKYEIFVMSADGTNVRQLTTGPEPLPGIPGNLGRLSPNWQPLPSAPLISKGPTVSGSSEATLTATAGTWLSYMQATLSFSYQWQRCYGRHCLAIPGATTASHELTVRDLERRRPRYGPSYKPVWLDSRHHR